MGILARLKANSISAFLHLISGQGDMNSNRLIGTILVVVGIAIGLIAAAFLFTNEALQSTARILGLGIALLVLVAPLIGAGVYLLNLGGQETQQQATAQQQRKLLDIVQTRGSVPLSDL